MANVESQQFPAIALTHEWEGRIVTFFQDEDEDIKPEKHHDLAAAAAAGTTNAGQTTSLSC